MGQQHDFYLVQSGNLVPRAALWRGFLACFQQPSLLRPANLDSSDVKALEKAGIDKCLTGGIWPTDDIEPKEAPPGAPTPQNPEDFFGDIYERALKAKSRS